MKLYFVLIFVAAIQLDSYVHGAAKKYGLSQKNVTKTYCKRFKCPPIEDPVCIRMVNKKAGSKTKDIHIMLMNKCELTYMNCHRGFQATEVSMKNCDHNKRATERFGKARAKRSAEEDKEQSDENTVNHVQKSDSSEKETISKEQEDGNASSEISNTELETSKKQLKPDDESAESEAQSVDAQKSGSETENNEVNIQSNAENSDSEGHNKDNNINTEAQSEESHKSGSEIENNNVNIQSNAENSDSDRLKDNNIKSEEANKSETDTENNKENIQSRVESSDSDNTEQKNVANAKQNDQMDHMSNEDKHPNKNSQEGSIEPESENYWNPEYQGSAEDQAEYTKDCPMRCPAQSMMVCAKTNDGIYRSFLSVCHVRMYNCKHPEKKVELISRYPCVLAAPYIDEAPQPRTRSIVPEDPVLRFIRCRDMDILGVKKSRCNFEEDNKEEY